MFQIDLLTEPVGRGWIPFAVAAGACLAFVMIFRLVRSSPTAVALLAVAAVLIAVNPLFDEYERAIAGESRNYWFVSSDEPYAMTDAAWRSLTLVRQLQEGAELLIFVLLLGVFLIAADSDEQGRSESRIPPRD